MNYNACIKLLSQNRKETISGNLTFIEKKIPDSDVAGELDPRVYAAKVEEREHRGGGIPDFSGLTPDQIPVEAIRAGMGAENYDMTTKKIKVESVVASGRNGDIPVRIYIPEGEGEKPAVVYFHGGGFIGGSIDVVENPCKGLAEKANAIVFNVDYRLAPEHPFPAPVHDCYDAAMWVHENAVRFGANPDMIVVAGDSAGGNLATVCVLLDKRNRQSVIKFQALIYPVVTLDKQRQSGFTWSLDEYEVRNDAHRPFIMGDLNGMSEAGKFLDCLYYRDHSPHDPLISPLLADDLKGLPPAIVFTAEFDYLRPEGEAYARKLAKAGVDSKIIRYKGMTHAFIDKFGIFPQAEDCIHEIALKIREIAGVQNPSRKDIDN